MLKALWAILGWKGLVSFILFFALSGAGIFGYGYLRGRDNERDRFYTLQNEIQARIESEVRERYEVAQRQAQEALERLQGQRTRNQQNKEAFDAEVAKAPDPCPPMPSGRVREFNRAVREANEGVVPARGDGPVR